MLGYLGFAWGFCNTLVGWICVLFSRPRYLGRVGPHRMFAYEVRGGEMQENFDAGGAVGAVKGGIAAMGIGHILLIDDARDLADEHLVLHESRHCWQSMVLGPFFGPAYGLASLIAVARGLSIYKGNWFERDARRAAGEEV